MHNSCYDMVSKDFRSQYFDFCQIQHKIEIETTKEPLLKQKKRKD